MENSTAIIRETCTHEAGNGKHADCRAGVQRRERSQQRHHQLVVIAVRPTRHRLIGRRLRRKCHRPRNLSSGIITITISVMPNLLYTSKGQLVYYSKLNAYHQDYNNWHLKGSVKNSTSRYISFFLPITQWCSISDVLFTGRRGVRY